MAVAEVEKELCPTCGYDIDEDCDCVYCNVCDKPIRDETAQFRHRHLWWSNQLGWWRGTGSEHDREYPDDVRQNLFGVFSKIGPDAVEALGRTIQHGGMGFQAIHLSGTTFGYDSVVASFYGKPNPECRNGFELFWCGERFTHDLTEEQTPDVVDGVMWLLGLDNERTPEQNALTLKWIKEWQDEQRRSAAEQRQQAGEG